MGIGFIEHILRLGVQARVIVAAAPMILLAGLAGFGVVVECLLLMGKFDDLLIWPIGIIVGFGAMVAAARLPRIERPGSLREQRWVDGAMLVMVLLWGAWNITLTSQHLFTDRDPATYANAAAWLVSHDSLRIATPDFSEGMAGFTNDSPGFETFGGDRSFVSAQGQHFFPALLGSVGRIVGPYAMLHATALIGMLGLVAVYGFARLVVKPGWALLATATLGLTLPMLYFTRDSYTEPLTLGLLFSGLTFVWVAHQTRRLSAWLLAGLVLGAAAMTRIDVYIPIAGLVASIAVAMASLPKAERKGYTKYVLGFLAVVIGLSALSFVDMKSLSMPYLAFHMGLIGQEILGFGVVVLASAVFVALAWRTRVLSVWRRLFGQWRYVGAVIILVSGMVLVSRPLWFVGYTNQQDPNIATLQARRGIPVEPRSYTEQSVNWVAWYSGAPLAILGLIGLAMTFGVARRNKIMLLSGVGVVSLTALVYFVQPSIAPDQIWASRRYLSIVLPGLLIFAMVPLRLLWETYGARLHMRQAFAVLGVAAIFIAPLEVSGPFIVERSTVQAPIIMGVCEKLPRNAAVLWVGDGQYYLVQATRSFCGVPSMAFTSRTLAWHSIDTVTSRMRAAGYAPVIAVMSGDAPIVGAKIEQLISAGHFTLHEMETRLSGPPRYSESKTFGVDLLFVR